MKEGKKEYTPTTVTHSDRYIEREKERIYIGALNTSVQHREDT
jgi:hypothetical protein